ncbi:ABC transporter permease [Bacteroidota bacterium]
MFKHYLNTAIRYLLRNKGLTIINILGLAIGICVFVLIMHYVRNELSYNKFITRQETLTRMEFAFEDGQEAWTTSAMGPDCVENVPEAISFVRFKIWGGQFWKYNNVKYQIPAIILADSNVIELFDFEMIAGDPKTALREPAKMVITESMARIIFGDEEALGKGLISPGGGEVLITGVIKDPQNFHYDFDMILSFVTLGAMHGEEHLYNYKTYQYDTYIEIEEHANLDSVEAKFDRAAHQKFIDLYGTDEEGGEEWRACLRPIKDVYFARGIGDSGSKHGNKQFVIIFIIIAVFIILIACINFINISTAKASARAVEIGIKKVVGSSPSRLVVQLLAESTLVTLFATLLGLLLVELVFPEFENIVGTELRIAYLENPINLLLILAGVIIIGVSAGLYPAFYLTSFKPVSVLKGEKSHGKSAQILRKFLIVFQFTISIILIIGTVVVYSQLQYLRKKDLGFNKEHIVNVGLRHDINQNREVFKENLLAHPQIENVSYSYMIPGAGDNWEGFYLNGEEFSAMVYQIDPEYMDVMQINLSGGRNFSRELITDKQRCCIINETLARELMADSLVGKQIDHPEWYITAIPVKEIEIIGIVEDFHFKSLRQEIGPLMFVWNDLWINYINIRIQADDTPGALNAIEKEWKAICTDEPFEYCFMDENFERMYRTDRRLGKIFTYFACLAIFIAILGLFGLAAFIAEQRTREIGIRKAMGATISQVSVLLVKEFTWLILIASVIAWVLGWFWAKNWLQEFAYRINLNIWIFIVSTMLSLVIAWITVLYQTMKAANTNPADSLRHE